MMYATKSGWPGKTFALASSSDSGGRKSRIRRSKEERKSMVESFIKKYQQSNRGNFPSLNLTHKEVGGSFYTVREIVREIIQENRVLGPPKFSLEGDNNSDFLEQNPLGSISMTPQSNSSLSDRTHVMTIISNQYQVTNEEQVSISKGHFVEPEFLELDGGHAINGLSTAVEKAEVTHELKENVATPGHNQHSTLENEPNIEAQLSQPEKVHDEGISRGSEKSEDIEIGIPANDSRHIQDVSSGSLPSDGKKLHELGTQDPRNEQIADRDNQIVNKTEEFRWRIDSESVVREMTHGDKDEAKELENLDVTLSHDVVVETFPLRPVSKTIHDIDEKPGKLTDITGTSGNQTTKHMEKSFDDSPSGLVNEKAKEQLTDQRLEINNDEKALLNSQGPSTGSSRLSATSEAPVSDINYIKDLEAKDSLPNGTKAGNSPEQMVHKQSTVGGRKAGTLDNSGFQEGGNPTFDRINLETWERKPRKPFEHEANPLLALVKAFISVFVKFWTE